MAVEVRPFAGPSKARFGRLNATYHFSFGPYHDPARMGVGPLRVWIDDAIAPHTGFGPHPQRDMGIVSHVRSGAITHLDSLGNAGRTSAGDVQVMSAGSGIRHAEYKREEATTTIFQIWIEPRSRGLAPRWAQRAFARADRAGQRVVLASGRAGDDDTLPIDQDAALLGVTLEPGRSATQELGTGRPADLVAATGRFTINGVEAVAHDGVLVAGEPVICVEPLELAEILVVDLP